jgi:hypothetical protein
VGGLAGAGEACAVALERCAEGGRRRAAEKLGEGLPDCGIKILSPPSAGQYLISGL